MDKTQLTPPEMNLTFGLDMEAPTKRASLQRRSSLFKNVNSSSTNSPPKKISKSCYEQNLIVEAKQWHSLIKASVISNANLAKDPLKVCHTDLGIELRSFVDAAPDFQQIQSDSMQFAKLSEFFVFRMDHLHEKQNELRNLANSQIQQSSIDLAIMNHLIIPKYPSIPSIGSKNVMSA